MSIAEIFPSEISICLYLESIKSKCIVLDEEKYSEINLSAATTYFTRSNFNEKEAVLDPSPLEWRRMCSCNCPVNPDLEYVQCEKCEEWFHVKCIQNFIPDGDENYICAKCDHLFLSDSSSFD